MNNLPDIDITEVFLRIEIFMSQVFTFMMDTYIVVANHRFSIFNIGIGALAVAQIVKNLLPMFDHDGEYEMDEDVNNYFNEGEDWD